jgi:hypothetical protein
VSAWWDEERAATLARQALQYLERVYPPDAPLVLLAGYHEAVLLAERIGHLPTFEHALREWCRAGKRVAMDASRSQGLASLTM